MINAVGPGFTLDASVVVKWFVKRDEPGQLAALRLRDDYEQGAIEILCPDLLAYEVANVLRYKAGIREQTALEAIRSLYLLEIMHSADEAIMSEAVRLARRFDISVYDAIYVSFARHRACRLITADQRICRKLSGAADILPLALNHRLGR